MKFTVMLAWIALAVTLSAAPKFGVVRVKDIYRELPSTKLIEDKVREQREAIPYNIRGERFRTSIKELMELNEQLRSLKDEADSEIARKLARSEELKRQEAETLRREYEVFRAGEEKRINVEMVAATRQSLDRICAAARQIAVERNLDGVFDTSGDTNTGLPLMLYAADAEDLTEDVIALLDEKPAGEAEEAPESADAENQPELE